MSPNRKIKMRRKKWFSKLSRSAIAKGITNKMELNNPKKLPKFDDECPSAGNYWD